jgi:hypothetical protein
MTVADVEQRHEPMFDAIQSVPECVGAVAAQRRGDSVQDSPYRAVKERIVPLLFE